MYKTAMLKAERFAGSFDFDPAPEYKSTGKVVVALGIVGQTEPKPAVAPVKGRAPVAAQTPRQAVEATETTPAIPAFAGTPEVPGLPDMAGVAAVPSMPIWGMELGINGVPHVLSIRRATNDPQSIKALMVDALRKLADEIDESKIG